MKRLTRLDDIPYTVEIREPLMGAQPGATWDRRLVVMAKVVGSDGFVYDEDHVVEFGEMKVTKRSVTVRWAYGSLARPDEPARYDDGRSEPKSWELREVSLPRVNNNQSASRKLTLVRDRMVKLLAPQHSWLFRLADAMEFCQTVHNHIIVKDVMES